MSRLIILVKINRHKVGVLYEWKGYSQIEICLWNDDRAKNEQDILRMNAAYPAMVAFAARA